MRITQCSILYRYITDVHENRTPFIEQRTERIDFRFQGVQKAGSEDIEAACE